MSKIAVVLRGEGRVIYFNNSISAKNLSSFQPSIESRQVALEETARILASASFGLESLEVAKRRLDRPKLNTVVIRKKEEATIHRSVHSDLDEMTEYAQ